ncbi:MAG: hypothetical protein OQK73_00725, partial [Gammaproteobacteria bacterium]|nr:hypothetical protein [Gammaproteobacteria bacterium]
FAEFLASRSPQFTTGELTVPVARTEPKEPVSPVEIPRPDGESIIAAVKRLSATYHMLSKDKTLQGTADLVSQSLLGGCDTVEVIDELEEIFLKLYEKYTEDSLT